MEHPVQAFQIIDAYVLFDIIDFSVGLNMRVVTFSEQCLIIPFLPPLFVRVYEPFFFAI